MTLDWNKVRADWESVEQSIGSPNMVGYHRFYHRNRGYAFTMHRLLRDNYSDF